MPICISPELPAYHILSEENIFVMDSDRAAHQDIRPLRVLVLNLMPKKIETECQFLRLLSNTPLQVNVEFLHVSSHISIILPHFIGLFPKFRISITMAALSQVLL